MASKEGAPTGAPTSPAENAATVRESLTKYPLNQDASDAQFALDALLAQAEAAEQTRRKAEEAEQMYRITDRDRIAAVRARDEWAERAEKDEADRDAAVRAAEQAEGLADFVIKDVWGVLLAYYTDIPEAEIQRLIARCESFNRLLHARAALTGEGTG